MKHCVFRDFAPSIQPNRIVSYLFEWKGARACSGSYRFDYDNHWVTCRPHCLDQRGKVCFTHLRHGACDSRDSIFDFVFRLTQSQSRKYACQWPATNRFSRQFVVFIPLNVPAIRLHYRTRNSSLHVVAWGLLPGYYSFSTWRCSRTWNSLKLLLLLTLSLIMSSALSCQIKISHIGPGSSYNERRIYCFLFS